MVNGRFCEYSATPRSVVGRKKGGWFDCHPHLRNRGGQHTTGVVSMDFFFNIPVVVASVHEDRLGGKQRREPWIRAREKFRCLVPEKLGAVI